MRLRNEVGHGQGHGQRQGKMLHPYDLIAMLRKEDMSNNRMSHLSLRIPQSILIACAVVVVVLAFALTSSSHHAEAIEIGKHNTHLLPAGKEADGIIGDFVLRNQRIHAVISGGLPNRRANMMHDRDSSIPGTVFDLDLVGAKNDQITSFRPGHQRGQVSYVKILSASGNTAAIEAVTTAAKGDGLYTRHLYTLESGWQHLEILSTFRNESSQTREIEPLPVWKAPAGYFKLNQFSQVWKAGDIRVGDSIDPFDKRSYAWAPLSKQGISLLEDRFELRPGQERSYALALAVADSPLEAFGLASSLIGPSGRVKGSVMDSTGKPALHASLLISVNGVQLPAYPGPGGDVNFLLPPGEYEGILVDLGRPEQKFSLAVEQDQTAKLQLSPPPASAVSFRIKDSSGQPSPAKVQFLGIKGTDTPNFGTDYRAHGCDHQYQTHDGAFTQQVPPGAYLVRITRGPEYDLFEKEVQVKPEKELHIDATLARTVDTTGWISTDYHSHSTPSGDNHCNTHDRLINFAAEQVEFIPTTEHNRIYDWTPYIKRLGLSRLLSTTVGLELTGRGQHFNSFPLEYTPLAQDGGAPEWQFDPRLNAIVLRNLSGAGPDRWVQANHPRVGEVFNDSNADGVGDGGFLGFESLIDAAEVWSTQILNPDPTYFQIRNGEKVETENRTFGWLQLLNQGRHVWCVAVSDAHRVFGGNGVGGWRTYVPSSTDEPGDIDSSEVIRNSKAGQMMITNGPFLEVATDQGLPIGSRLTSPGGITLRVRVQTPNWIDIDRVQVLVNSRPLPEYNYTRSSHGQLFGNGVVKFEQQVRVNLPRDAHLIVVATGESSSLEKGWGRSPEAHMRPVAFTNPIYVDVDGNGFQPNGDTLDHPLLVAMQSN